MTTNNTPGWAMPPQYLTFCCGVISLKAGVLTINVVWVLYSLILGILDITHDEGRMVYITAGVLYLGAGLGAMFGIYATFATANMPLYYNIANVIIALFIILSIGDVIMVTIMINRIGVYCIKGTTICEGEMYRVFIPYMILVIIFSIYFGMIIHTYAQKCAIKASYITGAIPLNSINIPQIPINQPAASTGIVQLTPLIPDGSTHSNQEVVSVAAPFTPTQMRSDSKSPGI